MVDTALLRIYELDGQDPEATLLQRAFAKFAEASRKLEARYETLRLETEALRRRLKEKDEEIARSAKLAMLGETAAALAHEVRNPLGSMKLFSSLLRDDLKDRPASLELIDGIEQSLNSLEHVVSNILQFARQKPLALGPINIHSIIREVAASAVPPSEHGLSIELNLSDPPFIAGNEHALRQVFQNLILNSAQAMRRRGIIRISSRQEKGHLVVEVADNGPGVAEELRHRLFEPFVTTKAEGTGLGLAIVRQILRQHHASVDVRNEGGAVFRLSFPQ